MEQSKSESSSHEQHSCLRKKQYDEREHAVAAMFSAKYRYKVLPADKLFTVYLCRYCQKWHIGGVTKKVLGTLKSR